MPNYIVIHKESNLIIKVIASSTRPWLSAKYRTIRVSDSILAKYYKRSRLQSRNGSLVDAGELANVSPAFLELLQGRS